MPPYLSLLRGNRKSKAFPSINQLNQLEDDNKQQQQINLDSFFPNSPLPSNSIIKTNSINSKNYEQKKEVEEEEEVELDSLLDFGRMLNEQELLLPSSFIMLEQDLSIYSDYNSISIISSLKENEMGIQDKNFGENLNDSINLEIQTTTTILDSIDNSMKLDLMTTELELPEVEEDSFVFEPVEISLFSLKGKNKAIEVAEIVKEVSIEQEINNILPPMLSETVTEALKPVGRKPRASLAPLTKLIVESSVPLEQPAASISIAESSLQKSKIASAVVPKYVLPRAHPAHPRRLSVLPALKELPAIVSEEVPEVLIKKPYLKRSAPISTNETLPLPKFSKSTRRQSALPPLPPLPPAISRAEETTRLKSALSSSTSLGIPTSTLSRSNMVTFALPPPSFSPILPSITAFVPIVPSSLNNRHRISLGIDFDISMEDNDIDHINNNDMSEISLEWSGHKGKGREEMGRMTSTPRFERILNRDTIKDVGSSLDLRGRHEDRELEQKLMRLKPRRSEIVLTTHGEGRKHSILLPPPQTKKIIKPLESILQDSTTDRRASRAFVSGESLSMESKVDYQPVASTSKSVLPGLPLNSNESQVSASNSLPRPFESSTNRRASRAFNSPPALRKSRLSILPSTTSLSIPLPTPNYYSLSIPHTDRGPSPPTAQEIKPKTTITSSKPEIKNGLTLPSGFGMEFRGTQREEARRRRVAERELLRGEKEREKENDLSKKRKGAWSKPSEVKRAKSNAVYETILPPSRTRNTLVASTRPARSQASQISANRRRSSMYDDNPPLANGLTEEALSNLSQLDSTTTNLEKKVSKYLQSVMDVVQDEEDNPSTIAEEEGMPDRILQPNRIFPNRIVPTSTATVSSAFKFSTTTRSARQPLPPSKELKLLVTRRTETSGESNKSGKFVDLNSENKIKSFPINTITTQLSGSVISEESRLKRPEWAISQKVREDGVKSMKEVEKKHIQVSQESAHLGLKRLRDNLTALQTGRRGNRI